MQHLARALLVTLGLGTFAVVLSFYPSQPAAAAPGATSVIVTNTPLPVTGNVNANIINASVPVTGTVAVSSLPSINFGGNVTVGNTSANPVPTVATDNPGDEPFGWGIDVGMPVTGNVFFLVPSTTLDGKTVKRAVIETVSAGCSNLPVAMNGIAIGISLAGGDFPYNLPLSNGPDPTAPMGSQTVRLYEDPGSHLTVIPPPSETGGTCVVTFFGHYVTQ